MPQLLPTFALSRLGDRQGGISFAEATRYDYHPKLLLTLLAPKAFGDPGQLEVVRETDPQTGRTAERLRGFEAPPAGSGTAFWETAGYVGLAPLVLAGAAAALGHRRARVRALAVLLVLSLLLTLGKWGGLLRLFYLCLPGFSLFRLHTRFVLVVDLALALLAGLGLTLLIDRRRARPWLAVAIATAAIAVSFADLVAAFGDHNPTIDRARWTLPPRAVEVFRAAEGGARPPARVLPLDWDKLVFGSAYYQARGWKGDLAPYDPAREMLYPDYNLLFSVPSLDFYHPVYPLRMMQAYLATLEFEGQPGSARAVRVNPKLASTFNVRYLITPYWTLQERFPRFLALATGRMQPAATAPGPSFPVRMHLNPGALPRAFLVPRARIVVASASDAGAAERSPAPEAAIHALLAPGFDPEREVVLDRGPSDPEPPAGEPGEPIRSPVRFLAYDPVRVEMAIDAPRPCWLFLGDTYLPGWQASIDGAPSPIYPANVAGRAVAIPAGAHRVVFHYRQPGWRLGLGLALAGAILAALAAGIPRARSRRLYS